MKTLSPNREWVDAEGRRRTLQVLDTSEDARVFLLKVRNGRSVRLSQAASCVLSMYWDGEKYETIATELAKHGITAAPDEVRAYHEALRKEVDRIEARPAATDRAHWLHFPLLPAPVVSRVARHITPCYSARFAAPALVVAAIVVAAAANRGLLLPRFGAADFALAYALYFASVLIHEFGHATALLSFGRQPGPIGFTLYLTFPALYSDVTDAWSLTRLQRAVVGVGGSYLQLLCAAAYASAYLAVGSPALGGAVALILLTTAFNLNPIFKMDGYWIVADALGVTNLAKQPLRLMSFLVHSLNRRVVTPPLPWSRRVLAILAVYSVASFVAWTFFTVRLTQIAWRQIIYAGHTVDGLLKHTVPAAPSAYTRLGMLTVGLVISSVVLCRLAGSLTSQIRQWRGARRLHLRQARPD